MDTNMNNQMDTPVTEKLTVSAMAERLDIARGTLYRRLEKSGHYQSFKAVGAKQENNSILYTREAWTQILESVGLSYPVSTDESVPLTTTPTEIQVFTGNHRNTLAVPQFPTEFNLGSLRSELATVDAHEDPLALAEQFINGADSLMTAMAEDEKAMAQKIAQTRQARQAVGRKVDQLKRRNDIYSLRTELLADRQNVETAALNEDFSVLQSMGNGGSGQ